MDVSSDIKIDIYKIYNKVNNKSYIGQTKTHTLNKGKLRPHGYIRRFQDHISEALNNVKRNQCTKLNNAIRKYGSDKFEIELLHQCEIEHGDRMEIEYIAKYNSMATGYNLTLGGNGAKITEEIKEKLSIATKKYFEDQSNKKKQSTIQWQNNDTKFIESMYGVEIDSASIDFVSNTSAILKFYYSNEYVARHKAGGKYVDCGLIAQRFLRILIELGSPPVTMDGTIEDSLQILDLYDIKIDEQLFIYPICKLKQPINHPRSCTYEIKDEENRLKRLENSNIKNIKISLRTVKEHKVLNVDVFTNNGKYNFTFGGKHQGIDYYSAKCLDFIKKLGPQNNVTIDQIEFRGRNINNFLEEINDDHPLKLLGYGNY
jgi:hypothetical protein